MAVPDGLTMAGSAGRVRSVADRVETASSVQRGGTWDRIYAEILADADSAGQIDWALSVDSTINRAHQHATNLPRSTGGLVELQESEPGTV